MPVTKLVMQRNVQTEAAHGSWMGETRPFFKCHLATCMYMGVASHGVHRLCDVTVTLPYMSTGQLVNLQLLQM